MGNQYVRRKERERQKRRTQRIQLAIVLVVVAAIAVVIGLVASGGGDSDAGPPLSELGEQGKQLAVTHACVGCHGREGEGTTGPPWVGLLGKTVTLRDGSTLVADRDYIVESIVDPNAKLVAGYGQMPQDPISDADLMAIVQYIIDLSAPADTATGATGASGGTTP